MELVVPVLLGLLVAALAGPVLRRLPEPPADEVAEAGGKSAYAALATVPVRLGSAGATLAASTVVVLALPPRGWAPWLVLATVGVLLAVVDGLTTWLPAVLCRAGWVLVLLTAPLAPLAGGDLADVVRPLVAGALTFAFFTAAWRLSRGGLAFGDVRLAPLIGAAGGAIGTAAVAPVLLAATLGAVLAGLLRSLRGRRGPFPYAPGLVAGAFVGLLLLGLLGRLPPG